jgi:hypothetical protein
MTVKHLPYFMICTIVTACTLQSTEHSTNTMYYEKNADITTNSSIGNDCQEMPINSFDSTIFLGSWQILDADVRALTYPYVGNMPSLFQISELNQFRHKIIDTRFEKSSYSFFVNQIDTDSLILYLHPAICKCEGLEVRYRKL